MRISDWSSDVCSSDLRVTAHQRTAADDDVLQHLVHRMAHVDVAFGVGRAVVEDEAPAILPLFAQQLIDADLLPAIENARFLGGEARLHRKVGLRQEDGVAPLTRGGVGCVGPGVGALKGGCASAATAPIYRKTQ